MKSIRVFSLKIFSFLEMKFSIYLNRRVFVMKTVLNVRTEIVLKQKHSYIIET